jgi:hypothetical protein
MIVFAGVGFLKYKSKYLNEREKCYGRQINPFNPHLRWGRNVLYILPNI